MLKQILQLYYTKPDFFLEQLADHLRLSGTAVGFALVLGLSLGIFILKHEVLANAVMSIINVIYTIPSISMFGFLIPLTGIGNKSAIIALTIYALMPITRNTYTGIRSVDSEFIRVATAMGATPRQILWRIQLPLALPVIIAGFRNMVVMTISLAGIASFIGAGGLGVGVFRGITTNNIAMTFASSLLIAAMALFFDLLFAHLEKRIVRNL